MHHMKGITMLEEMLSHGLNPGQFPLDGKIHRFKVNSSDAKKSGWALGFQNFTSGGGEVFQVVVYGNYQTGETFKYQSNGVNYSADDQRRVKEQIAKAKATEEKERARLQEETAREVSQLWETLIETGTSQYLIN